MKQPQLIVHEISPPDQKSPLLVSSEVWSRFFLPLLPKPAAIARQIWEMNNELDAAINEWFGSNDQSNRPLRLLPQLYQQDEKLEPVCLHAIGSILHHSGRSAILFTTPEESERIAQESHSWETRVPTKPASEDTGSRLKLVAGGQ